MTGFVRIIGGKFRGRKLKVIDSKGLRPTSDRVKEMLFNWLMHDIHGAHCLDAFAGTGALGFEAFSRGAASVLFVEKDKKVAKQLECNLALLDPGYQVHLGSQTPNALSSEAANALSSRAPRTWDPGDVLNISNALLHQSDCTQFLKTNTQKFDIIFLDPPFNKGLLQTILPACVQSLSAGKLYIECETSLDIEKILPGNLKVLKSKTVGEVQALLVSIVE